MTDFIVFFTVGVVLPNTTLVDDTQSKDFSKFDLKSINVPSNPEQNLS